MFTYFATICKHLIVSPVDFPKTERKTAKSSDSFINDPHHSQRAGMHPYVKVEGAVSLKNVHLVDCKPGTDTSYNSLIN